MPGSKQLLNYRNQTDQNTHTSNKIHTKSVKIRNHFLPSTLFPHHHNLDEPVVLCWRTHARTQACKHNEDWSMETLRGKLHSNTVETLNTTEGRERWRKFPLPCKSKQTANCYFLNASKDRGEWMGCKPLMGEERGGEGGARRPGQKQLWGTSQKLE